MDNSLVGIPCFGIAGNFTGHLEQAGEAADFTRIVSVEGAPKGIFPTYIPVASCADSNASVPAFLQVFPFDEEKIIFPAGEERVQIEPECGIVFGVEYSQDKISALKPLFFAASNDCSIRRPGAPKISVKKNWGPSSKGFDISHAIQLDSFSGSGLINSYRIASFLVRGQMLYDYGEDSAIRDYSYIYDILVSWCIRSLNFQRDDGPLEELLPYLRAAGFPSRLMISIGATRYTDFGQRNFLCTGDRTAVVLYPETLYSHNDIRHIIESHALFPPEVSALVQEIVV